MPDSRLTPFQQRILAAFFRHESSFFLTGGAALAGFHLGHRVTHDLDLFTTVDALDDGDRSLAAAAAEEGATVEKTQTAPDFRRRILRAGQEAVVVDLVRDRGPAGLPKLAVSGIQLDSSEEILANKLCALLSRSELRDLVDVYALEGAGQSVEAAMGLASAKDGSLTPAQLAWVLSQVDLSGLAPDQPALPGTTGPTAAELARYLKALELRLARAAKPRT